MIFFLEKATIVNGWEHFVPKKKVRSFFGCPNLIKNLFKEGNMWVGAGMGFKDER